MVFGRLEYRAFERRKGLGFEGLMSPIGGEIDPPPCGYRFDPCTIPNNFAL